MSTSTLRPAWGRILGLVLVLAAVAILLRHVPVITGLDVLGALLMGTGIGLATSRPRLLEVAHRDL